MIASCPRDDLLLIEDTLPLLVGDHYFDSGDYSKAVQLYLEPGGDTSKAEDATNKLIRLPSHHQTDLNSIAQYWMDSKGKQASGSLLSKDRDAFLLLQLYENPLAVAKSRAAEAYKKLGPDVIKAAMKQSRIPSEELHNFGRNQFKTDIDEALSNKFRGNLIEAVQWYLHRDDKVNAEQFAAKNIFKFSGNDLIAIARSKVNPSGLLEEADRHDILITLVRVYLASDTFSLKQAVAVSDRALSSMARAEDCYEKLIEVWDEHRNKDVVKSMLERKQPEPPGPRTVVFLNLFWNPRMSSRPHLSKYCMTMFGPKVVEIAVSSAVDDAREKFDILSQFDGSQFSHLRPPEEKPKAKKVDAIFKTGDRVIVSGVNNQAFNGKSGIILNWLEKKQRYSVKLDDGTKGTLLPSKLKKIDDGGRNKKPTSSPQQQTGKRIPVAKTKSSQMQRQRESQVRESQVESSSDDDSDGPPPLNDRDQSSSEDSSSSSDSPPSLLERGNRSESSMTSNDDPSNQDAQSSSSSSVPSLTRKDNSSSDDEGIPSLIGPDQQSSSSDESIPRGRTQQRPTQMPSNAGARGGRAKGRGERNPGGTGRGRGGRRRRK